MRIDNIRGRLSTYHVDNYRSGVLAIYLPAIAWRSSPRAISTHFTHLERIAFFTKLNTSQDSPLVEKEYRVLPNGTVKEIHSLAIPTIEIVHNPTEYKCTTWEFLASILVCCLDMDNKVRYVIFSGNLEAHSAIWIGSEHFVLNEGEFSPHAACVQDNQAIDVLILEEIFIHGAVPSIDYSKLFP